jgi:hypothetical protein
LQANKKGGHQKGATPRGIAYFEAQRVKLAAKAEADLFLVPELAQVTWQTFKASAHQEAKVEDDGGGGGGGGAAHAAAEARQDAALLHHVAPPWLHPWLPPTPRSALERRLRRGLVAVCLRRPGLPLAALCAPTDGVCTLLPATAAACVWHLVRDGVVSLKPLAPRGRGVFQEDDWELDGGDGGAALGRPLQAVRLCDLLAALNCLPLGAETPTGPSAAAALAAPLCAFLAPGGLVRLAALDGDDEDDESGSCARPLGL